MPTTLTPAVSRNPASRGRRFGVIALVVVVLLCAAWSVAWYVLANRAEATLAEVMARMARSGRDFSCGSRQISGFPFQMLVHCDDARLELPATGGKAVMTLPHLRGLASATNPTQLQIEADGPLSIEAPGRPSAEISWRSLRASVGTLPAAFHELQLMLEAPVLHLRDGQNMTATSADRLELRARQDTARPAADDAVEVTALLSRLVSPVADSLAGNDSPADMGLEFSVSKVAALSARGEEQPLPIPERWRLAGGSLRIAKADVVKGPIKAGLAGEVALDDQHRASGRLDASIEGAEALISRLGLPAAAGGFLKLGGSRLKLPLALANGRAAVGPISVARLLPLY